MWGHPQAGKVMDCLTLAHGAAPLLPQRQAFSTLPARKASGSGPPSSY